MPHRSPTLLSTTRSILRVLTVLNAVAGVGFLLFLGLTFGREDLWLNRVGRSVSDPTALLFWMRAVLLVGVLVAPIAHLLLIRLLAIVHSVQAGSPFTLANAARLKVIAWSLLAIQLLDLGYGWISFRMAELQSAFGWSFGLTGWLAVLLLFVLARVFERGAAMEDELAGTV